MYADGDLHADALLASPFTNKVRLALRVKQIPFCEFELLTELLTVIYTGFKLSLSTRSDFLHPDILLLCTLSASCCFITFCSGDFNCHFPILYFRIASNLKQISDGS
jgi:hypothetical protein